MDPLAVRGSARTVGPALVAIGPAVGTLNWDVFIGANTPTHVHGTCRFTYAARYNQQGSNSII